MGMIHKNRGEAVCNIGRETTVGESASSLVTFPFIDEGIAADTQNQNTEIMASSTFPYVTKVIETERSISAPFKPYVHAGTIRDIIEVARRQSGSVPSFTIEGDNMGIAAEKHAACVVESLELAYSRESGGDAFVLQATQQWRFCKRLVAGTVTRTSEPAGNEFLMNQLTGTVNGASLLDVLAWTYRLTNSFKFGPADQNYDTSWIVPGMVREELELRAAYDVRDWLSLVVDRTTFSGTFVLGTGTANETVTFTAAQCKGQQHSTQRGDDQVTESLKLVTQSASGGSPLGITYGTAIGPSRLGLSS